jgi:hypothetical protein
MCKTKSVTPTPKEIKPNFIDLLSHDNYTLFVQEPLPKKGAGRERVAKFEITVHRSGHLTIIHRPIADHLVLGETGGEITSSVDERVRLEAHVEGPPLADPPDLFLQVMSLYLYNSG